MGTEQVRNPINSNRAEEINSPFEIFSAFAIEKITPKIKPMTPRITFTRPNIVKKPSLIPEDANNEMISESRISATRYGIAFFMKVNFLFQTVTVLHDFLFHPCKTNSWFQKV